ncbi:hypothetical protein MASR2M117_16610 [Paludibacter sp.]
MFVSEIKSSKYDVRKQDNKLTPLLSKYLSMGDESILVVIFFLTSLQILR